MEPIRIELEQGQLIYEKGAWRADGASKRALAIAQEMTDDYVYSPGHGYPNYLLAIHIAVALEGKAILPELPPTPEGVMH